jgi:hypothetical protein
MLRSTEEVVQQLLDEMSRTVREYHPEVQRTPTLTADLIPGTAMFPGGAGLWRGQDCFGPLPKCFPEAPFMFVAHNFDSITAFERSHRRGGEADSMFWRILLEYLQAAMISPDECFFTNALMGLKPGSALKRMPTVAGYLEQCRSFLLRQIEIVAPRAIIALGNSADAELKKAGSPIHWTQVRHPSAREFTPLSTRHERARRIGESIRAALAR